MFKPKTRWLIVKLDSVLLFKTPLKSLNATSMQTFKVGEYTLPIVKTHRKKSIGLKPKGDSFELHVPKHLSNRSLKQVLNDHASWIQTRLHQNQAKAAQSSSDFDFKVDEPLMFLGETYHFQPQASTSVKRVQIALENHVFQVLIPSKKYPETTDQSQYAAHLKTRLTPVLSDWYKKQAVSYFEQKMPIFAKQIGVEYTAIQVKKYKSRWGSCYSDGRIQFNWKLLQAPTWVIDYVIVHELCHLKHANHSPAFWNLVAAHYPQTQEAKRWLKTYQYRLIGFLS